MAPVRLRQIASVVRALRPRTKVLLSVWLLFAALVALRIHGSSIALAVRLWEPDRWDDSFLAAALLDELPGPAREDHRAWLMGEARAIRSDEWANVTLWSLAQFMHEPRFPVINTNIGAGQNMLLAQHVPVLHPALLARPATWGYLLFGPQAGLAWCWWFQTFFCFTALLLLFEVLLRDLALAAFGALWFCASAYVVAWSHWPAYVVAFPAMACVAARWVFVGRDRWRRLAAAVVFGVSAAGFVLHLYPPWLVPLGYAFAAIFVGLLVRDRLPAAGPWRAWVPPLALGLLVAAALVVAYAVSAHETLSDLAGTVYPGKRRLRGADTPFARLFGGFYNVFTLRNPPRALLNESESAGFFLFFPAVLAAAALSARVRRKLDVVAWAGLAICVALAVYCHFGFPAWLADATLLARAQGFRAQIAVGFLSILVSLYVLRPGEPDAAAPREPLALAGVGLLVGGFYLWQGVALQKLTGLFAAAGAVPAWVWLVTLAATALAVLLAAGAFRPFALAVVVASFVTAADFNPLMRGFVPPEESEMGKAVRRLVEAERREGKRSYWMPMGRYQPPLGNVLAALGARSVAGAFTHPHPALWKLLDPTGRYTEQHNRVADVSFVAAPLDQPDVRFVVLYHSWLNVGMSPLHPTARALGIRYVLSYRKDEYLAAPPLRCLDRWRQPPVAIWEVP